MYHTPLTWYKQENLGNKAQYEALPLPPEHCGFCISSRCKADHKDSARRSYKPVHPFAKPVTQRFFS
jgi:hypothetical protein